MNLNEKIEQVIEKEIKQGYMEIEEAENYGKKITLKYQ